MRLNLNLNRHYEGLGLEAVNEIFARMLDMKPNIDGLKYLLEESEERFEQTPNWRRAKAIGKSGLRSQVEKLDELMVTLERETIFVTSKEKTIETDDDVKAIIEKYEYLMSEPEKEKDGKSSAGEKTER